jgi:ribosomal protein S18 acetylase RimI-like enzyme
MFDEEPKDYQAAWEKRKRRIIELEEPSENSIAVRFYEKLCYLGRRTKLA